MPIITVLLVLLVAGVLLWLINKFIPMESTIKTIFNAVVIIVLVIWILKAFNLISILSSVKI